jgi:malate synthase
MEDLATDRIYRLMIAQRVKHRDHVQITEDGGKAVPHTPELVSSIFDEELGKLIDALPDDSEPDAADKFRSARQIAEAMIRNNEIDPV